jgi:hypothetical protein
MKHSHDYGFKAAHAMIYYCIHDEVLPTKSYNRKRHHKPTTSNKYHDSISHVPRQASWLNPHAFNYPQIEQERLLHLFQNYAFTAEHPNMPITSDDMLLILDSGSSIAITFDKSDFISKIHPFQHSKIKGIAEGLAIQGIDTVQWTVLDTNNKLCHLELEALYVPDSPVCLLPPQQLSSENNHAQNGAWIGSTCKVFYDNHVIEFSYNASSNLPVKKLAPGL